MIMLYSSSSSRPTPKKEMDICQEYKQRSTPGNGISMLESIKEMKEMMVFVSKRLQNTC